MRRKHSNVSDRGVSLHLGVDVSWRVSVVGSTNGKYVVNTVAQRLIDDSRLQGRIGVDVNFEMLVAMASTVLEGALRVEATGGLKQEPSRSGSLSNGAGNEKSVSQIFDCLVYGDKTALKKQEELIQILMHVIVKRILKLDNKMKIHLSSTEDQDQDISLLLSCALRVNKLFLKGGFSCLATEIENIGIQKSQIGLLRLKITSLLKRLDGKNKVNLTELGQTRQQRNNLMTASAEKIVSTLITLRRIWEEDIYKFIRNEYGKDMISSSELLRFGKKIIKASGDIRIRQVIAYVTENLIEKVNISCRTGRIDTKANELKTESNQKGNAIQLLPASVKGFSSNSETKEIDEEKGSVSVAENSQDLKTDETSEIDGGMLEYDPVQNKLKKSKGIGAELAHQDAILNAISANNEDNDTEIPLNSEKEYESSLVHQHGRNEILTTEVEVEAKADKNERCKATQPKTKKQNNLRNYRKRMKAQRMEKQGKDILGKVQTLDIKLLRPDIKVIAKETSESAENTERFLNESKDMNASVVSVPIDENETNASVINVSLESETSVTESYGSDFEYSPRYDENDDSFLNLSKKSDSKSSKVEDERRRSISFAKEPVINEIPKYSEEEKRDCFYTSAEISLFQDEAYNEQFGVEREDDRAVYIPTCAAISSGSISELL